MTSFPPPRRAHYNQQSPLPTGRPEEVHYRREDDYDRRSSTSARQDDGYGSGGPGGRYQAPRSKTTLFVSGFDVELRARDIAWEFERYGRLIRCDVPALKSPTAPAYAFVEFCSARDAEDAYYDMHGRTIDGRRISVQYAKQPQSKRHDRNRRPPPYEPYERGRTRSRSRSPVRRRSASPPRRAATPERAT